MFVKHAFRAFRPRRGKHEARSQNIRRRNDVPVRRPPDLSDLTYYYYDPCLRYMGLQCPQRVHAPHIARQLMGTVLVGPE